jgi:transposase-like protein
MEQGVQNGNVTRQRVVRTEEQILGLLEEYEKSGFTLKEYAEICEIHETTLYSWLRKYRKGGDEEQKGFATIEVTPVLTGSKPTLFAEIGNIKLYREVSAEYLKALVS